MSLYKVTFEEGRAISARIIERENNQEQIELVRNENTYDVQWYVLECDNEHEAVEIADKVVWSIWKGYLL